MATYQIGQTITPGHDVATGKAPGQQNFSYGRLSPTAPGKVIGTRNVNGQLYYNIDQSGIGGGTGWAAAADIDRGSPSPAPGAPSAISAGSGIPSGNTPRTDFVSNLYSQFQTQDAARQAESDKARKALVDYYTGLEDPTARYQRLRTEQGLPEQENLVNALTKDVMQQQDILDELEPSVNNRIKDFFIDEGDRASMLARESDPVIKNLNKLLRNKQYEEIGLSGKQQLVAELLNLSFRNDEMRAKPFELGVDFTKEDREMARQIFESLAGRSADAFSQDVGAQEERDMFTKKLAADREASTLDFEREKQMAAIKHQYDLEYKLTESPSSSEGKKDTKQKTETLFNNILGESRSEWEIWKNISDNEDLYRQLGYDLDYLYNLHSKIKGSIGKNEITSANRSSLQQLESLLE